MEVNKYEAERCIEIARKKESNGDLDGALKFIRKSINLYPTSLAEKYELKLKDALLNQPADAKPKEQSAAPSAAPSTSTTTSKPSPKSPPSQPERSYTPEQVEAVKKIKQVENDFYKVLGIEKTANETQIKKAYRKLALQFHPDKNGAPGADEAFKLVGKAFAVLSDENKRAHYDRYGGESDRPESFASQRGHGPQFHFQGGSPFGEEIDPEVLFNMFFGGGGPAFMTQTFPNQRYRRQQFRAQTAPQAQIHSFNMVQLLPFIFLLFVTLISYLISPTDAPTPGFRFNPTSPYSHPKVTKRYKVDYFVNPSEFSKFKKTNEPRRFEYFERQIENTYGDYLRDMCHRERIARDQAINMSSGLFGIFGVNKEGLKKARAMQTPSCTKLSQYMKRT